MDVFFYPVLVAGAIAGASTGLLGVYIVGMRMPFIGTCISHAAMVGAIYAKLLGLNPTAGAIVVSMITAASLAGIRPSRYSLDINVALGILFSLMLGLTFLGIGLVKDSRSEMLNLLWGTLLFVDWDTVRVIAVLGVILVAFNMAFDKELKAILFSRTIAAATGVRERFVYFLFLGLCGIILAVNLPAIGGLLIFSLITNPAAAAYQVCRGYRSVMIVSMLFGIVSAVAGFLISLWLDLPTGACIVLISAFIFALAAIYRAVIGRKD